MPVPGEQPSLGVSARRSACDRCRQQKQRCLREVVNPDGRCNSCAKAQAQCMTSPIFHMRNMFVPNQEDALSNNRRCREDSAPPIPAPPRLPSEISDPLALGSPDVYIPSTLSPSTSTATATTLPTLFDYSFTDRLATPDTLHPRVFELLIPSDVAGPWEVGDSNLEHLFSGSDTAATDQNKVTPSTFPLQFQATSLPPYVEAGPEPFPLRNSSSLNFGVQDHELNHVEELSRINLNLVTQLRRMQQPYVTLKTLIVSDQEDLDASAATPLENILSFTRQFLDVLSLIASSAQCSSPPIHRNHSQLLTTYEGDQINPISEADSGQSFDSSPLSNQPSEISILKTQPDNALLLLLLICYIRVLRIHVALLAHINSTFSNIPLDSGNLQATMIIQLVTNMFEKIEALLGLPREFCIGSREESHYGLLRNGEFLEIANSMLRQEDTGLLESGKGGMKSLRSNMRKAKQLLRSRIAP